MFANSRLKPYSAEDVHILRESLNLLPSQLLKRDFPDSFKGFADVTYFDDDLRLMRGNRDNLFILQKLT